LPYHADTTITTAASLKLMDIASRLPMERLRHRAEVTVRQAARPRGTPYRARRRHERRMEIRLILRHGDNRRWHPFWSGHATTVAQARRRMAGVPFGDQ
jgi:hypothetical protein